MMSHMSSLIASLMTDSEPLRPFHVSDVHTERTAQCSFRQILSRVGRVSISRTLVHRRGHLGRREDRAFDVGSAQQP